MTRSRLGGRGLATVVIPPPRGGAALERRRFLQWSLGVATTAVAAPLLGCGGTSPAKLAETIGTARAALGATDGPIYKKWIQAGGEAVVGAATSDVTATPGGVGSYETFANGVIVYSNDWGAVLLSRSIFDAWLALDGQTTPDGANLFTFIGFPTDDSLLASNDTTHFERGMLVLSGGSPQVVYGDVYVEYFKATPSLGLPTGAQQSAPGGGRSQTFEDGDIYWSSATGAATVRGAILARWLTIGDARGALGYPLGEEQTIYADVTAATLGTSQRFQNGVIYSGPSTGTWELTGPIRSYYEQSAGGPNAPGSLGLPTGPQGTSTFGVFNDFQNGVIVNATSGPNMGTFGFAKLQLFVNRVTGAPEDCVPVFGCSDPSVYFFIAATSTDGLNLSVRRPDSGTYGGAQDLRETFDLSSAVHSGLSVDITFDVWDSESIGSDEQLAHVHVTYGIDNLWGLFDGGDHFDNTDGNGATINFSIKNPLPFDPTKFRQNLFWSFSNFSTDSLTYDQFAATFTDVSPNEEFYLHPFNALYYQFVYQHLAKSGNCFGMCLESVFAQVGESLYAEPIFRYWPDTQTGGELDGSKPNERQTINEINIKHGYQIGSEAIDWFLGRFLVGATHDPMQVFVDTQNSYSGGDWPLISILDSYFGGSGHVVRPYAWDQSDPNRWIIFVANPNDPAGTNVDGDAPCYIAVDTSDNSFTFQFSSTDTWSGGTWTGGRMFYFPFRHLHDTPSTPFWEILGLIVAGTVVLLGDTGQTQQVTDGSGKTLFQSGLGGPPARWDQFVQDPGSRVPNLTRVPMSDSGSGPIPLEMFYGRGAAATYKWEVVPAAAAPAGTPYEWVLHTPTLSAHVSIPGTPGTADILTASSLHTPNKSLSVGLPAGGSAKAISVTLAATLKQRWIELSNLNLSPSQTITAKLSNAGYGLALHNDGPATSATVRVQVGLHATPVVVGTVSIPSGDSPTFAFDAPKTTLAAAPSTPDGNAGWYKTAVTVTLTAMDFTTHGIAYTEYSKNGITWTPYGAPFTLADEGVTTLEFRSKDNDGDLEDPESRTFQIDTRAPVVTGGFDKPQYTRVDPITVTFGASDPMPGSGLRAGSLAATFDGQALTTSPETLPPLLWQPLGTTNTLTVTAGDVAGWTSTSSFTFQLVATFASLTALIQELSQLGEITNGGIANSFLAKVSAASAAEGRGQPGTAANQLNALLHEIAAQTGKHISPRGAALLTGDVNYVAAHL